MSVQKKFFVRSKGANILRYVALFLIISSRLVLPANAARTFHYKTYHPKTGEVTNQFYYSIEEALSGGYQVHWVIDERGAKTEEDYVLGENFETLRFRVVNVEEETDYVGERRENSIFVRGQFKGEKVERIMAIDSRPFYYNPKLGLAGFVRSGKKKGKFWGFQNKELNVYPMKAINKGLESIAVAGRGTKAIKVYWTVDDFRSAFFKRTYWFRADSQYLKQKSDGGKFRELVSEENGEYR